MIIIEIKIPEQEAIKQEVVDDMDAILKFGQLLTKAKIIKSPYDLTLKHYFDFCEDGFVNYGIGSNLPYIKLFVVE